MIQKLRALTALYEKSGSILSNPHDNSQLSLTPGAGSGVPSRHTAQTHTCKQNTHKHTLNTKNYYCDLHYNFIITTVKMLNQKESGSREEGIWSGSARSIGRRNSNQGIFYGKSIDFQ